MSTADDDVLKKLDMQAELEAAMAAQKSKKPVRASRRKGEVTAPALTLVDDVPVVVAAMPALDSAPVPVAAAAPAPEPAPEPVVASTPAPVQRPVDPQGPEAPRPTFQRPVGPFPPRAGAAPQPRAAVPPAGPAEAGQPAPPTPRQLAVMLTRAGRRPEGFELPRDDRRRRALISCPPRVLGPGETARFEVAAPDAPGAYELRAVQFPSFGAPRLLVEGILLEDFPLLSGSVSAESFTTSARESVTPFAVLAPESKIAIVVHNVSPTPVPVHPSALLAVLEPRAQQG